jgi:hypothetical protein
MTYLNPEVPCRSFSTINSFQGNISIILDELETSLGERIKSREWLDEPTRKRALSKLSSIHELSAYPVRILDNAYLNDYYSVVRKRRTSSIFNIIIVLYQLDVSKDVPYLLNHLSSTVFNSLESISLLEVVNNRSLWNPLADSPTISNAAYYATFNQICKQVSSSQPHTCGESAINLPLSVKRHFDLWAIMHLSMCCLPPPPPPPPPPSPGSRWGIVGIRLYPRSNSPPLGLSHGVSTD